VYADLESICILIFGSVSGLVPKGCGEQCSFAVDAAKSAFLADHLGPWLCGGSRVQLTIAVPSGDAWVVGLPSPSVRRCSWSFETPSRYLSSRQLCSPLALIVQNGCATVVSGQLFMHCSSADLVSCVQRSRVVGAFACCVVTTEKLQKVGWQRTVNFKSR
jgi:hypothetical protein